VFFGRLEERKGVALFCDALDLLARNGRREFQVAFMGRPWKVNGQDAISYLNERAEEWPFKWRVIADLDHSAALGLLSEPGRLAVIPSLEDNLPNTVLECLCARIPFIASRAGGIPEMLADEDIERVTFQVDPESLANKISAALDGDLATARPAIDPVENRHQWVAWHSSLTRLHPTENTISHNGSRSHAPLISVCLTHHDRPTFLRQAVASLEAQDWTNFEVVLVDDGSTSSESLRELDRIEKRFADSGWRLIRQPNRYVGAARNAAAAASRGEYLLFMDDDNYAKPDELRTFVEVISHSDADILTCLLDVFDGDDEPLQSRHLSRWMFLGAALVPGIFHNCFGDSNFFIRKTAFDRIGGFTEDFGTTCEDWEFLAKAVLQGYRLEVVPKALVWYRMGTGSMYRSTKEYDNRMRMLRPYLDVMPPALRGVLPFALATKMRLSQTYPSNGSGGDAPLSDDDSLRMVRELATGSSHRKLAALLDGWLEYRAARSRMSTRTMKRLPVVVHLLMTGQYHRYAHGIGSALRDLRKPPKPELRL
jgi:glycosyltransferase involved in cell wall biosynthesis